MLRENYRLIPFGFIDLPVVEYFAVDGPLIGMEPLETCWTGATVMLMKADTVHRLGSSDSSPASLTSANTSKSKNRAKVSASHRLCETSAACYYNCTTLDGSLDPKASPLSQRSQGPGGITMPL
ncbi:unnamed protein product [Pleuronectes platessa]|uniref:Uncharacterized protein n=1 Tax=Pleuronectes platessa TaxID=8262 RepID=A0A9N7VDN3_PLEPL|nr:unnamed protein product [Pleuronectes platessa]